MDQFTLFVTNHWELATAFSVVLLLLILNEVRERIYGIPKITPQQVTGLINHQQAMVIDLREVNAYKEGHIVGAKNIPFSSLKESINKIKVEPSQPVILACAYGQQSQMAGKLLRKLGYEKVMILIGGITAWRNDNYPLVKRSKSGV